jgi:hypothetical protein
MNDDLPGPSLRIVGARPGMVPQEAIRISFGPDKRPYLVLWIPNQRVG